ncbi:MAG TPA: hypothetical protein VFF43_23260 [Caldimonas sp.]|nr:hypothetical protein [Caldimonas sp.]
MISARYSSGMDLLPSFLTTAALEARDGLAGASQRLAAAAGHGGSGADAATAARAAVFGDALLAEIRTRLQELKSVAKP